MKQLLRQYDWLKTPALVALGAILLAAITNNLIASRLAPYTVPDIPSFALDKPSGEKGGAPPPETRNVESWTKLLTTRCPFGCDDSTDKPKGCTPACKPSEVCEEGECVAKKQDQTEQPPGSNVPTESDLKVKLLGSMVADNPQYSMAMIKIQNSKQTYVVSPGDILPGNAVITRIRRDRIFVRREDGSIEYIRLERTIGGAPGAPGGTTSAISRSAATAKRGQPGVDFSEAYKEKKPQSDEGNQANTGNQEGVQQVNDNQYRVSRKYVEEKLNNPAELIREVRLQQNYEGGERSGVRLSGMKGSGFYSSLGFESGDVIKSVNGEEINRRSQATQIWRRFQEGGSISVTVERNGETIEREYEIED